MMERIDAYCTCGRERDTALPEDDLLRQMDRAGVDRAVIAPEDREVALANREGNRRIAGIAARSSGRLIAACAISPWHGDDCPALVDDAVAAGARMLVLAPALQGFIMTDEVCDPLLRAAARRRLPVYVHTGPHGHSAPTQLSLTAMRHPGTSFILGHCGSTDHASDMKVVMLQALPNVWFELSFVRPWGLPTLAGNTDPSRLIFGSGAPRNDLGFEWRHFDKQWPVAEHADTYGGNIARLLDEVTPC